MSSRKGQVGLLSAPLSAKQRANQDVRDARRSTTFKLDSESDSLNMTVEWDLDLALGKQERKRPERSKARRNRGSKQAVLVETARSGGGGCVNTTHLTP